jgi:hypothetical protein
MASATAGSMRVAITTGVCWRIRSMMLMIWATVFPRPPNHLGEPGPQGAVVVNFGKRFDGLKV